MEDCDTAPPRSPYKPSASDSATASCNFCSASVSSLCTSSLSALALLNKCSPWESKKRVSITKARLSHNIVKEQSGRLSNMQQKGNTSLNNPFTSSSTNAGTLLPPPTNVPSPPHTLPSTLSFPLHLLMIHLQMKATPNEQRDLAGRSGKQMLDLMDQLSKKEELIQQWNCMTQKEEII